MYPVPIFLNGWARPQPIGEDVAYVTSPLIDWYHVQPLRENISRSEYIERYSIKINGAKIIDVLFVPEQRRPFDNLSSWRSDTHCNSPIKSQLCPCHEVSAVVELAKLWHDWIITFHVSATPFLTRFMLWAHKTIVKWADVCSVILNNAP